MPYRDAMERGYPLPSDDGCIECGKPRLYHCLYCVDHLEGEGGPMQLNPERVAHAEAHATAERTAHAMATNPRRWCRCGDPDCEGECAR